MGNWNQGKKVSREREHLQLVRSHPTCTVVSCTCSFVGSTLSPKNSCFFWRMVSMYLHQTNKWCEEAVPQSQIGFENSAERNQKCLSSFPGSVVPFTRYSPVLKSSTFRQLSSHVRPRTKKPKFLKLTYCTQKRTRLIWNKCLNYPATSAANLHINPALWVMLLCLGNIFTNAPHGHLK